MKRLLKVFYTILVSIFLLSLVSCPAFVVVGNYYDEKELNNERELWKQNNFQDYSFVFVKKGNSGSKSILVEVKNGQNTSDKTNQFNIYNMEDVFAYIQSLDANYAQSDKYAGTIDFGIKYNKTYHYPEEIIFNYKEPSVVDEDKYVNYNNRFYVKSFKLLK